MAAQPQPFDEVIRRVQGEYIEMPGLRLTPAQAQRLWGLDRLACDTLLGALHRFRDALEAEAELYAARERTRKEARR